jgi:hypothetical protein
LVRAAAELVLAEKTPQTAHAVWVRELVSVLASVLALVRRALRERLWFYASPLWSWRVLRAPM